MALWKCVKVCKPKPKPPCHHPKPKHDCHQPKHDCAPKHDCHAPPKCGPSDSFKTDGSCEVKPPCNPAPDIGLA